MRPSRSRRLAEAPRSTRHRLDRGPPADAVQQWSARREARLLGGVPPPGWTRPRTAESAPPQGRLLGGETRRQSLGSSHGGVLRWGCRVHEAARCAFSGLRLMRGPCQGPRAPRSSYCLNDPALGLSGEDGDTATGAGCAELRGGDAFGRRRGRGEHRHPAREEPDDLPCDGHRPAAGAALDRAAQSGSEEALEQLYRRHWPWAHRAAYLVVHDAAAAEDIAQEAFLAAVRALDRFDRRRPFGPWLNRIVVNRAIDWARARALRREAAIGSELDVGAGSHGERGRPGTPGRTRRASSPPWPRSRRSIGRSW